MNDRFLTTKEVADLLRISPRTLENWRQRGGGPPYRVISQRLVRYSREELMVWVRAQNVGNTVQAKHLCRP